MKAGDLVWVNGVRWQGPAIVRGECCGTIICDYGEAEAPFFPASVRLIATADEIKQRKIRSVK